MLFDRVIRLESEMRGLTGHYEVTDHKLDSIVKRLDRLVIDLDFRLRSIEDTVKNPPAARTLAHPTPNDSATIDSPPEVAVDAQGTVKVLGTFPQSELEKIPENGAVLPSAQLETVPLLPDGTVKERYDVAFTFIRTDQMKQAERAFDEFLESHPNDTLASNAYYWKAESIYARKDFERAAAVFLQGYQAFPEGVKAPDMLLKLAKSLSGLGVNDQACATLVQLKSVFPDAKSGVMRRANRDFESLACNAPVAQ